MPFPRPLLGFADGDVLGYDPDHHAGPRFILTTGMSPLYLTSPQLDELMTGELRTVYVELQPSGDHVLIRFYGDCGFGLRMTRPEYDLVLAQLADGALQRAQERALAGAPEGQPKSRAHIPWKPVEIAPISAKA